VNATRPSLLKKRRSSNPRYRWSGSFVAETPGLGPPTVTPVHAVSVGAFDTSVPGQRRDGAGAHAASEAVGSERFETLMRSPLSAISLLMSSRWERCNFSTPDSWVKFLNSLNVKTGLPLPLVAIDLVWIMPPMFGGSERIPQPLASLNRLRKSFA
jgi:hypothetical protein